MRFNWNWICYCGGGVVGTALYYTKIKPAAINKDIDNYANNIRTRTKEEYIVLLEDIMKNSNAYKDQQLFIRDVNNYYKNRFSFTDFEQIFNKSFTEQNTSVVNNKNYNLEEIYLAIFNINQKSQLTKNEADQVCLHMAYQTIYNIIEYGTVSSGL